MDKKTLKNVVTTLLKAADALDPVKSCPPGSKSTDRTRCAEKGEKLDKDEVLEVPWPAWAWVQRMDNQGPEPPPAGPPPAAEEPPVEQPPVDETPMTAVVRTLRAAARQLMQSRVR